MTQVFDIICELVAETDMAILVDDGDTREWLPKSQIEFERQGPQSPSTERDTLIVTAPQWLLEEKGFV